MRLAFAFLAVIILLCGCSGNPQGDEEKVDPVTTFARMEVGDERNMVWMDLDNMVWKAGLNCVQVQKTGGGASPVESTDIHRDAEFQFSLDFSGVFTISENSEVLTTRRYAPGFFEAFDILQPDGTPRVSLEAGEGFSAVEFFDGEGILRIKLSISELNNEWRPATIKITFYSPDGLIMEI